MFHCNRLSWTVFSFSKWFFRLCFTKLFPCYQRKLQRKDAKIGHFPRNRPESHPLDSNAIWKANRKKYMPIKRTPPVKSGWVWEGLWDSDMIWMRIGNTKSPCWHRWYWHITRKLREILLLCQCVNTVEEMKNSFSDMQTLMDYRNEYIERIVGSDYIRSMGFDLIVYPFACVAKLYSQKRISKMNYHWHNDTMPKNAGKNRKRVNNDACETDEMGHSQAFLIAVRSRTLLKGMFIFSGCFQTRPATRNPMQSQQVCSILQYRSG